MRLGGRLSAAIAILDDIDRRHRPAADALKDWGLSHRFAGSADRAAIGNIVYDALRRRRSAAWLLDGDAPRALAFGAVLLQWGVQAEELNARLDGDGFAPPPLSPAEIASASARPFAEAPAAVRADCPDWCAPHLSRTFGERWVEEGAALAARPPLDMRANRLKADREKVVRALAAYGAVAAAIAPDGVRIAPVAEAGRHPNVQAEPAFHKGWFEVQDEGSQIVASLAAAGRPRQVLDFCAGAGGKTLSLSAGLANHGQVFAYDADKARLAPIFDRLRRAGSRNVQVIGDAAALAGLGERMDVVLVDAPCSGSGTWRRRPDAKWRLTERQLQARSEEQAAILAAAAAYVKPGGRLAYVTCSLFAEENGDCVAGFLETRPDFRLADPRALWEGCFPRAGAAAAVDGDGILLSPARTGTDGFFFAALDRAG